MRSASNSFDSWCAARPDTVVFAIVRKAKKSVDLQNIAENFKIVHIVEADVVDHQSLEHSALHVSELTGGKLDYLIYNAARIAPETIFEGYDDLSNMDAVDAECITAFKTNALGVIHSIAAFLPLLRVGPTKKIAVIGAGAADLKLMRIAGMADMVAYSMTKAAAHVATTKWALRLEDEGFVVVTISLGLVDTSGTKEGERAVPAELGETFRTKGFPVLLQTVEEGVAAQLKHRQPQTRGQWTVPCTRYW